MNSTPIIPKAISTQGTEYQCLSFRWGTFNEVGFGASFSLNSYKGLKLKQTSTLGPHSWSSCSNNLTNYVNWFPMCVPLLLWCAIKFALYTRVFAKEDRMRTWCKHKKEITVSSWSLVTSHQLIIENSKTFAWKVGYTETVFLL